MHETVTMGDDTHLNGRRKILTRIMMETLKTLTGMDGGIRREWTECGRRPLGVED